MIVNNGEGRLVCFPRPSPVFNSLSVPVCVSISLLRCDGCLLLFLILVNAWKKGGVDTERLLSATEDINRSGANIHRVERDGQMQRKREKQTPLHLSMVMY